MQNSTKICEQDFNDVEARAAIARGLKIVKYVGLLWVNPKITF